MEKNWFILGFFLVFFGSLEVTFLAFCLHAHRATSATRAQHDGHVVQRSKELRLGKSRILPSNRALQPSSVESYKNDRSGNGTI